MQNTNKVYMILTNGFYPDIRVFKEAKYLCNNGFDTEILCWDRRCEYKDKVKDIIEGVNITRFSISSKPGTGMRQIGAYIKFIKEVRKYLKDKEYSYLHCHDFDGVVAGMFTKKKKKKQIIFDMHEIYDDYSYSKMLLFKYIFKKIINKVNYIIYVNEDQTKNINSKNKLIFLPNYPDLETYTPIDKEKNSKLRINYIGALRDYKSLESLIKVSSEKEEWKIGLYGIGTCYEEIKKEYGKSNIILYGKYNGITESGKIYRDTDILYCSYNPEVKNWKSAYPVKLYEAIITLTPIIVSKDTKVGDFVEKEKIGETIEYGNVNSIKEAINKISTNYGKYVEEEKRISNKYRWSYIVTNLDRIYKRK